MVLCTVGAHREDRGSLFGADRGRSGHSFVQLLFSWETRGLSALLLNVWSPELKHKREKRGEGQEAAWGLGVGCRSVSWPQIHPYDSERFSCLG